MYNCDIPDEVLEQEARDREAAEAAGLWDDDKPLDVDSFLSIDQEQALWSAISTLSQLSTETNSSMSELLKLGGVEVV